MLVVACAVLWTCWSIRQDLRKYDGNAELIGSWFLRDLAQISLDTRVLCDDAHPATDDCHPKMAGANDR